MNRDIINITKKKTTTSNQFFFFFRVNPLNATLILMNTHIGLALICLHYIKKVPSGEVVSDGCSSQSSAHAIIEKRQSIKTYWPRVWVLTLRNATKIATVKQHINYAEKPSLQRSLQSAWGKTHFLQITRSLFPDILTLQNKDISKFGYSLSLQFELVYL